MKKAFIIILFAIFSTSLFANNVSEKDVSNAFVSITDAGYIAASNFISFKRVDYDSIAIKMSPETSLPEAILVNGADLSDFLKYFPEIQNSNNSGFSISLIPTIDPIVRERLLINDWKKGESIVTGAAVVVFPKGTTFQTLITNGTNGVFPKVALSFNFFVEGSLYEESLQISGILIISADSYGVPIIQPVNLKINEEEYNKNFFEKAPLLLTMKNDVK